MKKIIAIALLCCTASIHATVIDFEGFASTQFVSSEIAGVTISSFENGVDTGIGGLLSVAGDPFSSLQINGDGVLTNCMTLNCPFSEGLRSDVLRLDFDGTVEALSLLFDGDSGLSTFEAYDSTGMLIESITAASEPTLIEFASAGIDYIDILQEFDNFVYAIDDVTFTASAVAVPEPSMLALIGLGLVGFGVSRKKINV